MEAQGTLHARMRVADVTRHDLDRRKRRQRLVPLEGVHVIKCTRGTHHKHSMLSRGAYKHTWRIQTAHRRAMAVTAVCSVLLIVSYPTSSVASRTSPTFKV